MGEHGGYESVLTTQELGPGTMEGVEVRGERVVLVNVGQTYYALQASCPNDGTDLARAGRLMGEHLICPSDDWVFDVRTGRRVEPPGGGDVRLRRYAIRVEGNEILVGPEVEGSEGAEAG